MSTFHNLCVVLPTLPLTLSLNLTLSLTLAPWSDDAAESRSIRESARTGLHRDFPQFRRALVIRARVRIWARVGVRVRNEGLGLGLGSALAYCLGIDLESGRVQTFIVTLVAHGME